MGTGGTLKQASFENRPLGRGLHPPNSGSPGASPGASGIKVLYVIHLQTSITLYYTEAVVVNSYFINIINSRLLLSHIYSSPSRAY